ncbi:MAG: PorT family protein [Chlorobi bacterium]|nr:PorT family protein [Chlorobiota bacterium]
MKYFVLLFMVLLLMNPTFGQDKKWEIGGELGVNLSTTGGRWDKNDDTKNKWIATPLIGAQVAYNFTSMIALMAGFYMMKSGALYITENLYQETTYEARQRERFTTLRLPVLARFMWGTTWQYYGLFGFYLSKRLGGKYVYKIPSQDFEQSGKIKFKKNPDDSGEGDDWILDTKDYRRLDFGLSVGGGVRRQLGPGYLSFNVLFGLGFLDFYKWENKNDKPDGYKPYNNRNLSFQFGYAYPL